MKPRLFIVLSLLIVALSATRPAVLRAAVGGIDPSFSAAVLDKASVDAMAQQPDGKVLIGGSFAAVNGVPRNRLARLNADGSLDESFNAGPFITDEVQTVAVQPDGKILVGGNSVVTYHTARRDGVCQIG